MKEIIALLKENNRLLQEINNKLSSTNVQEASGLKGFPQHVMIALAEQYSSNPEIVIQEDSQAEFRGGNLFIRSKTGRVNANVSEKNIKSSFIKSISQKGQKLFVSFKSGKTYQYTSHSSREFNRVADILLTSDYVSKPFLRELRDNPDFDFKTV